MDPRAIGKATSRVRVARRAIDDLRASKTYSEFSDHWYVFLTAAKNVYTVLEQGAKVSPQSKQWFGARASFRKNDPLLQYLFEARNDDEHGLGSSIKFKPELNEIGVRAPGSSNTMRLDGGPFKNVVVSGYHGAALAYEGPNNPFAATRVRSADKRPIVVRRTPATTILVEIAARGDRKYAPPAEHLGKALDDTSPAAVAELALIYLESLVAEASKLA